MSNDPNDKSSPELPSWMTPEAHEAILRDVLQRGGMKTITSLAGIQVEGKPTGEKARVNTGRGGSGGPNLP